jgi:hypothetical protein
MVNELQNKIYSILKNITSLKFFESMVINSTFSFNKTAIIIWLALAMTSILYLVWVLIVFTTYIKHHKNTLAKTQKYDPKHQYQPIPMQPLPF